MNVVDAYVILENYVDSLAKGTRPNEQWRRVSLLKNSKEEILAAFKLVFAHAIFGMHCQRRRWKDMNRWLCITWPGLEMMP